MQSWLYYFSLQNKHNDCYHGLSLLFKIAYCDILEQVHVLAIFKKHIPGKLENLFEYLCYGSNGYYIFSIIQCGDQL